MTPKEVAHQNSKGIFTVRWLIRWPETAVEAAEATVPSQPALQALALPEKKVHVLGKPILKLPRTQVYLDIEGCQTEGFTISLVCLLLRLSHNITIVFGPTLRVTR